MGKKFKDTAIGGFLARIAPGVVDLVADVIPGGDLLRNLVKTDDMKPEDRLEFERLLKEYESKERDAYLADVQDARKMQIEALKQDDKFSKRFIYYFTAGSVLMGFAYIFFITFSTIPTQSQRFADTILGVVISIVFGTIYNFFFGSSKGSKDKDQILSNR